MIGDWCGVFYGFMSLKSVANIPNVFYSFYIKSSTKEFGIRDSETTQHGLGLVGSWPWPWLEIINGRLESRMLARH